MKFLCLVILISFAACHPQNPFADDEAYLEKEIANRTLLISSARGRDSLKQLAVKVSARVGDLLLLSKDHENFANIDLTNRYFDSISRIFGINGDVFVPVERGMPKELVAVVIRQNELSVLNDVAFKCGYVDLIPAAAP